MTRELREIPAGSGIHGRPILEDLSSKRPHTRHLAFHRGGIWWTWCGQRVPAEHRCPSVQQIASTWPYYAGNCASCHDRYKQLDGQPWPVAG